MHSSWMDVIPEQDARVYELAGFGRAGGLGAKPALVIVDVQYRTLGIPRAPIENAVTESYPTSCGERGWSAVDRIPAVVEAARDAGVPVVFSYVAPKNAKDLGRLDRMPAVGTIDSKGYDFPEEVKPVAGDVMVPKKHASAFFGTTMTSELINRKVDTLIFVGCTTSGCIRSSVVDAFSYNFHVGVVADCVYDRGELSHQVSLFDMSSKYADMLSADEAVAYFAALNAGE